MTTATSGAAAPAPALEWPQAGHRFRQFDAARRFEVCETTTGGKFYGVDYVGPGPSSPLFDTPGEARRWCEMKWTAARGQSVNGEEWPAEELPRW